MSKRSSKRENSIVPNLFRLSSRENKSTQSDKPVKAAATVLHVVSHNTFVAPTTHTLQDFEKNLNLFASMLKPGSLVLAELDRAGIPLSVPKDCEKLVHMGDRVSATDFVLKWLKRVGDACDLVILFDFKQKLLGWKKSQECVEQWKQLLSDSEVGYSDRPTSLTTAKARLCKEYEDKMLKVYSPSNDDSPLYAAWVCGSEFQAFDAVAKDARSALMRATLCSRNADGLLTFASTPLDYTLVKVSVEVLAKEPLMLAFMEDSADAGGRPKPKITKRRIRALGSIDSSATKVTSWITRCSFAAFAIGKMARDYDTGVRERWESFVMSGDDFEHPSPEPLSDGPPGVVVRCCVANAKASSSDACLS